MYVKSFDSTKIYYRKFGRGSKVMFFIHGWVTNWTFWENEIKHFVKKGYKVIAMDLRGHGHSGSPLLVASYELECLASDVKAVLDKEKLKKVVMVGHSLGGMTALMSCKMFGGRVKALVLAETTYDSNIGSELLLRGTNFLRHVYGFINDNMKIKKHYKHIDWKKHSSWSDPHIVAVGLLNTPVQTVNATLHTMFDFDLSGFLKKIKCPVLIIAGSKDELFPLALEKEMGRRIKKSKLEVVEGNHCMVLGKHKEVSKHIEEFVKKIYI